MKKSLPITTLFVDVGGVLLTNGWDHLARKRAAKHFKLNWAEMDERHRLVFETHEEGKLSFEEYLGWVVFYEKRPFTRNQFRDFMFAQSKPYPKMLGLVAQLKAQHGLKIVVVSNESREVNAHRIRTFKLDQLVDAFISSCFVECGSQMSRSSGSLLTLPRPPQSALSSSTTPRCSFRLRSAWGCEAFFTSITSPPAQSSLHSDCRRTTQPSRVTSSKRRFRMPTDMLTTEDLLHETPEAIAKEESLKGGATLTQTCFAA
jgi:hypothetical protein